MSAIPQITPKALAEQLALSESERPVLLDVRRTEEHALVALPGSVLIPLHELETRAAETEPWKGKRVVVYCHHGVRSLHGAAILRQQGVDACSLSGGIDRYSVEIDPSLERY